MWIVLILGGSATILFQLTMVDPRERKHVQGGIIVERARPGGRRAALVNYLDHPYSDRAASIQPNEMRATLAMIEDEHPVSRPPCAQDGTPGPRALI